MCGWVEGGPIRNTSLNAQGAAEALKKPPSSASPVAQLAGSSGGNACAEVAQTTVDAEAPTEVAQTVVVAEVRWVGDR